MKTSRTLLLALSIAAAGWWLYSQQTPEQKEARYIRRGDALYEAGDYIKARLEYKNAGLLKPADPAVSYRWGLVDEAEGDIRNAYLDFLQAAEQDPHFHPALLKIAHYQLAADHPEEAQPRVNTVLADLPDDPEAHALQGAIALRKPDFAAAEKEARAALEKDPANVTAFSVLTGLYLAQKDLAKAADILNEGIARNPKELALLMLRVKLYESPLDLPKLKAAYQAVFALKPRDAQYRIYLADSYLNAGKTDEAETALREGVAAIPDSWFLKNQLVRFLSEHRSMDAAEKEIKAYMQAYPDNADLYFWLADLYLSHNEVDKAIGLLQQIVSEEPNNKKGLNAQTSLAHIHFLKGDKALAEKLVNAVLAKARNNRDALFIRARIATDDGLYANAVSDLRIIIRDQPQDKAALQLLSEALLLQGYTDLAIDTQNQLLDLDPVNPAVRVRLAQMYNAIGDTDRALTLLHIVTQNHPDYPEGWEGLARVAIDAKDFATAQAAIRTLDTLHGQHMTAVFLEGQIAQNQQQRDNAEAAYEQVIAADPLSPLAAHAVYALATAPGTTEQLEKTARYIATLNTDNAYINTVLGECYRKLGKTALAEAAFTKAIAHHPTSQDPYLDLARMDMEAKKPDDALAMLRKAATDLPGDIRAPMLQADILRGLGRWDEAIAQYADVLNHTPGTDIAANNMAGLIADHHYNDPAMLEKALRAAERFTTSTQPYQLDTLGWVYYRQGKLDQALPLLARATASAEQETPEFHYHYGAALLKSGKIGEAKAELEQAVIPAASYAELATARQMLADMKH